MFAALFSNVYSLIKVTVPEGLTEVTIASESPLAGTAPFIMEAGALKVNPSAWVSLEQVKTVRLVPSEGEHLEAKTHDVLIFPGTHALTITLRDGTTTYEKTVAAKEYAAATYYNLNLTTVLSTPVTEYLASPFGGGTIEIPFVTNVNDPSYEVQIENCDGWLSYKSVDVKALTEGTVTLTVASEENITADRTATVTVTETTSGKSMVVSVTQKYVETELLGEYLESYTQYGQPYNGTLNIERSDDFSKGVYKVRICSTDLYGDYADGILSLHDGKYDRTLNVSNDFSTISTDNLSIGYSTFGGYKAIVPLGPAVLTLAEEALVGTYNETWTHPKGSPVVNGMQISASEEASYGQLYVKFMVTADGYYAGYATLDNSTLTVAVGGQSHAKFGTYWDPSAVLSLTVNPNGTLTMATFKDASYTEMSEYVATKVVDSDDGEGEGEGEGEGAIITVEDLLGTWHEVFSAGGTYENDLMTIKLTDDPSKGQLKVNMFEYSTSSDTYKLVCYANLSSDGKTLTVLSKGVDYSGMGTFSEDMVMSVSADGKKITYNQIINTSYSMPVGMLTATKN